jgi:hypothetical protein
MAKFNVIAPTIGEYNGKPTLSIPGPGGPDSKPITFGAVRWAEVLKPSNLDAIKAFVAENYKPSVARPDYSGIIARLKAKGHSDAEIRAIVGE